MKKKALLLASMVVLTCTVGVTALAVGGVNQLDISPVKADPTEYEITFDWSESTTVEEVVDAEDDHNYAICRTTSRGAKIEVVGWYNEEGYFTFKDASFRSLRLSSTKALAEVGAYQFSHITGFAIFFSGGSVKFDSNNTKIDSVESGKPYKELSIKPSDESGFFAKGSVSIASLTVWYSC